MIPEVEIICVFHFIGNPSGNFSTQSGELNGALRLGSLLTESQNLFDDPNDHPVYDNPGNMGIKIVGYNGTIDNSIMYWQSETDYNNNYVKIPNTLDVKFVNEGSAQDFSPASGLADIAFNGGGVGTYVELHGWQNHYINNGHRFDWDYGRVLNHEIGHALGLGHSNQFSQSECNTVDIDAIYEANSCWDCTPANCNCTNNTMTQGTACQCSWSICQKKTMHANMALDKYPFLDYNLTGEDYIISEDLIFDNHVVVPKNLIIESGATLTVNCKVSFNTNSRLIVKQGGKLVVEGGTLTSIENTQWRGIILEGNGLDQPNPYLPIENDDSGVVILNEASIRNARSGIVCHKLNEDWNKNYYGGLIVAINSYFLQCNRAVAFMPMINDQSSFTNVWFDNTGSGITLWNNHGVTFKSCNFLRHSGDGAIFGKDATVNVIGSETEELANKFWKNNEAIFLTYSTIPILGTNIIEYNIFENNEYDVILLGSSKENLILNNTFKNSEFPIDINGFNKFNIKNNMFDDCAEVGIKVISSGITNNLISNNSFDDNNKSIVARYYNPGTTFIENCFYNSEDYDVLFADGQVSLEIGSQNMAAGNCFSSGEDVLDIFIQNMSQFYYFRTDNGIISIDDCQDPQDLPNLYKANGATNEYDCSRRDGGTSGYHTCDYDLQKLNIDSLLFEIEFELETLNTQIDTLITDSIQILKNENHLLQITNCLDSILTFYADSLIHNGSCEEAFQLYNRQNNEYLKIKAFTVLLECDSCEIALEWIDDIRSEQEGIQDYITVQKLNLKTLCPSTQIRETYEQFELDDILNIANKTHPFAAYARTLWYDITKEYISLPVPEINRSNVVNRNSVMNKNYITYPNPTSSDITVDIPNASSNNIEINLIDINGVVQVSARFKNQTEAKLDISKLTNGLYFIEVKSNGESLGYQRILRN